MMPPIVVWMWVLIIPGLLALAGQASCAVIPVPTAAQARYQDTDFVALIHFNMGTFAHNGDPCCDPTNWDVKAPYATGKTSDPATFNPTLLNTTQWFDSIVGLGANIAVLTAKHGCGFALWPTKTKLPDGAPYGYNVGASSAAIKNDVLQMFVDSAKAAGVGYGFYYSIMKNFYLCHSFSGSNSCMKSILPGQKNITGDAYTQVAVQMVKELWTNYGDLTEIWVDSSTDGLDGLMQSLQPMAANSPSSPISWCGTESGHPSQTPGSGPYDGGVFSTGTGYWGDPNGTDYVPKFCDPQLFQEHVWFWEPNLQVRTLAMMIPIYHDIVGRGMVMELAFSIDRQGLVEDTHATVYKQLGQWVRECYGSPIAFDSGVGSVYEVTVPKGVTFDRVQIEENIVLGQRVHHYVIDLQPEGTTSWQTVLNGTAIGRKRIQLLNSTSMDVDVTLRLTIIDSVALPQIKSFSVFKPCATQ